MSDPLGRSIADTISFPGFRLLQDDRTSLNKLTTLTEIQEWVLFRAAEYHSLAQSLRSLHNASVPINRRLPPEVFMDIFSLLSNADLYGCDASKYCMLKLLHVCRHWRQIIMQTPSFWASVFNEVASDLEKSRLLERIDLLAFILEKTGVCPLSPSIHSDPDGKLVDMIVPHAHHLSVLGLISSRRQLDHILCKEMPQLVHLHHILERDSEEDDNALESSDRPALVRIDFSRFPKLAKLKISSTLWGITSATHTLQRLGLTGGQIPAPDPTIPNSFPLDPLLDTLRHCPCLELFDASFTLPSLSTGDRLRDHHSRAVQLPCLRKLVLRHIDPEVTVALLSHLVLPPTVKITMMRDTGLFTMVLPTDLDNVPYVTTAAEVVMTGQRPIYL